MKNNTLKNQVREMLDQQRRDRSNEIIETLGNIPQDEEGLDYLLSAALMILDEAEFAGADRVWELVASAQNNLREATQ